MDKAYVADTTTPSPVQQRGREYLARAPKTFRNTNTAWWDASQIYGYDERSRSRVKRDPRDPARLLADLVSAGDTTAGDRQGYLPLLAPSDPHEPGLGGSGSHRLSRTTGPSG